MQKKFEKYIRCSFMELTEENMRKLMKLVLYLEEHKKSVPISELIQFQKELKTILKPTYSQFLSQLLTKEKEFEDLFELQKVLLLLQEHIQSHEQLQCELGDSYEQILSYLEHPVRLKKYFPTAIYQAVYSKIQYLNEQEVQRQKIMQDIRLYDSYLSIFLTSRYTPDEMEIFTNISTSQFDRKWKNGFFEQYYSKQLVQEIANKKEELNLVKKHVCNNLYLLKDATMISYVRSDIVRVKAYEFHNLNLLKSFFATFGNIEKIFVEQGSVPNYNYALSALSDESFHKILKPEIHEKLKVMLEIEKEFQDMKLSSKQKLLTKVIEGFYHYNGNICLLCEYMELPALVLLRALDDRMIARLYGDEVYQVIQEALQTFQEKKYVLDKLEQAKVKTI